jgi:hypothetical protein
VRNDNNEPPTPKSIEKTEQITILLDKPYVDIIRVWFDTEGA